MTEIRGIYCANVDIGTTQQVADLVDQYTDALLTTTEFAESVQDIVANLLTAGSNITLNYNDALGTLTISSTGGGGGPGGTVQYEQSFTNASLTIAGLLVVTHNLDTYPSAVKVWSNVGDEIWPDNVSYSTSNVVVIDLSSFMPIVGTWTLSIGV